MQASPLLSPFSPLGEVWPSPWSFVVVSTGPHLPTGSTSLSKEWRATNPIWNFPARPERLLPGLSRTPPSLGSGPGKPTMDKDTPCSLPEKVTRWTSLPGIHLIRRKGTLAMWPGHSCQDFYSKPVPCVSYRRTFSTTHLCMGNAVKEAAKSQPVQSSERLQGHTKTTEQGPTFITNLLNSYRR